jgi:Transposase DDE domain
MFLHRRLVEVGGAGVSVLRLGGSRRGEMRITRFLRNPKVSETEMLSTAAARTAGRVAGRHILAIQDTTSIRDRGDGASIALHPTIAVDAVDGSLIGLVHGEFLARQGGKKAKRRERPFADKESRRWLSGAEAAARLGEEGGAALVTVIADREGDIYEEFALKPAGVELLIRAGQDRLLADGSRLFNRLPATPEGGRLSIDLPAAPGRPAREASLAVRFGAVVIACPGSRDRQARASLPDNVPLTLVELHEPAPPPGAEPVHWRLLTSHPVESFAQACAIARLYRRRWVIEQLFRTMKTKGFDIEAVRIADDGPFEKLAIAILLAAVTVLQLVSERDGAAGRPLADAFAPEDQPLLERVSAQLEGNTERQRNPHPKGSLAFAAWVCARLGGWTGYYGKPGPVTMLRGVHQLHAIKLGYDLRRLL